MIDLYQSGVMKSVKEKYMTAQFDFKTCSLRNIGPLALSLLNSELKKAKEIQSYLISNNKGLEKKGIDLLQFDCHFNISIEYGLQCFHTILIIGYYEFINLFAIVQKINY